MNQPCLSRLRAFWRARLSPEDALGLHLTIGALVLVLAVLAFGRIAQAVMMAGPITRLDVQLSSWFHGHATPSGTQFMRLVSDVHGTAGILGLSVLLAVWWARARAWDWVVTLAVSVPPAMLLNVLLKDIFARARPSFEQPLLVLNSYSFPSGHTAGATAFYGVLGAFLICRTASWRWRSVTVLLAALMVGLVGLSRVYLGAHYPSDVLAAMVVGSGWLALSLTAVATWRRRRRALQTG